MGLIPNAYNMHGRVQSGKLDSNSELYGLPKCSLSPYSGTRVAGMSMSMYNPSLESVSTTEAELEVREISRIERRRE